MSRSAVVESRQRNVRSVEGRGGKNTPARQYVVPCAARSAARAGLETGVPSRSVIAPVGGWRRSQLPGYWLPAVSRPAQRAGGPRMSCRESAVVESGERNVRSVEGRGGKDTPARPCVVPCAARSAARAGLETGVPRRSGVARGRFRRRELLRPGRVGGPRRPVTPGRGYSLERRSPGRHSGPKARGHRAAKRRSGVRGKGTSGLLRVAARRTHLRDSASCRARRGAPRVPVWRPAFQGGAASLGVGPPAGTSTARTSGWVSTTWYAWSRVQLGTPVSRPAQRAGGPRMSCREAPWWNPGKGTSDLLRVGAGRTHLRDRASCSARRGAPRVPVWRPAFQGGASSRP